ncbi:MAG: glycosyltransferase family 39 protein [Dehalococcoidia bacterium]|nr:glycosyltransferase family 39 protein [Dehalococcoidia bacterium]MDD5493726.1 glycosyltransferase family 39 protein [Dehalococcoidia bacterium]
MSTFSLWKSDRPLFIALCLIYILALTIRLAMTFSENINPWGLIYSIPIGEAARNLTEGRGYVIDQAYVDKLSTLVLTTNRWQDLEDVPPPDQESFVPYYGQAPGSSALLAVTYIIFSEYRFIYGRVIQCIIDALGCIVMFLVARELFNTRTGLIASLIYAVFLPIAYLSTLVIQDALMPVLVLTSFYFFIRGVKTDRFTFYILSALFVAISCYFQPITAYLPLFYGLALFIYKIHKHLLFEQILYAVKITSAMFIVLIIILAPWVIRNYTITGTMTLNLRVASWAGIWEGMGEFDDNPAGAMFNDAYVLEIARKELGENVTYGSPEFETLFRNKVMHVVQEQPLWLLSAWARRLPFTIIYGNHIGLEPKCPDGLSVTECREWNTNYVDYVSAFTQGKLFVFIFAHPRGAVYWGMVFAFATIPVILSLIGVWIERRNWRTLILITIVPVYLAMVHITVTTMGIGKSLLPGSIAYIILSAVVIDHICSRIKRLHRGTDDFTK